MLATDNLIKLYSYLLSFTTLYLSYVIPSYLLSTNLSDILCLSVNLTFRTVLAAVFFACKSWSSMHMSPENRMHALLDPVLLSLFFVTGFGHIPLVIFVPLVISLHYSLIKSLPKLYSFLILSWGETKRVQNEYGLSHLIQVESGRLRINTVFRLFWMTRAAYDAFFRCCDEPLSLIIRNVMVHGTGKSFNWIRNKYHKISRMCPRIYLWSYNDVSETFTGIVGLTVTVCINLKNIILCIILYFFLQVAAVCHQIGDFLLWLLYFGNNNEVDLNR